MQKNKVNGRVKTFHLHPIGTISHRDDKVLLELEPLYNPALKQLEHFSHIIVLWWADKHDNESQRNITQVRPPYAEDKLTGIFATRAEYRPNPIGLSTCKVKSVNHARGLIEIYNIDAFDNTPILDIKGYFPICDRVQYARIPQWLDGWGEWMPDEGLGFFEEAE